MKHMNGMKYKLPKMMSSHNDDEMGKESMEYPDMYQRSITIPVNDEIMEYAEIGEECMITLTGAITGINSSESEDGYENKNITLMVTMVEKYGDYEAEKDFSHGMDRKMNRY